VFVCVWHPFWLLSAAASCSFQLRQMRLICAHCSPMRKWKETNANVCARFLEAETKIVAYFPGRAESQGVCHRNLPKTILNCLTYVCEIANVLWACHRPHCHHGQYIWQLISQVHRQHQTERIKKRKLYFAAPGLPI